MPTFNPSRPHWTKGPGFVQDGHWYHRDGTVIALNKYPAEWKQWIKDSRLSTKDAQASVEQPGNFFDARKKADEKRESPQGRGSEKGKGDQRAQAKKGAEDQLGVLSSTDDKDQFLVQWWRGEQRAPFFAVKKAFKDQYGITVENKKQAEASLKELKLI